LWKNHGLFHSFSRDFSQKHFSTFFSQGFPRGNVEKFLGEWGLGWSEKFFCGTHSVIARSASDVAIRLFFRDLHGDTDCHTILRMVRNDMVIWESLLLQGLPVPSSVTADAAPPSPQGRYLAGTFSPGMV
jgi:hypothetical protein